MTIVPKKKPDPRSSNSNSVNKSNALTGPGVGSKEQLQDELHQDQDQQLKHQHQQRRSPLMQCSSSWGDQADEVDANYQGYDINAGNNEHNHDRRYRQHHNKYTNSRGDDESNVNHVILITVINPHYPITCDLIHQICNTYGKVNRIVIFKKNGVQAMVEFDNVEAAKKARSMLQGCDIYSGCCTLKIEFAKPARLNVHRNDSESFDYTNPNLTSGPMNQGSSSEADSNDNHQQPNHNQQHQQQHNHHQLQSTSGSAHHGAYMQSANAHHLRGSGMVRRSGAVGGLVDSIGGDAMTNPHVDTSGHNHHQSNHFHQSSHMHASNHQHSKAEQPGNLHQQTNYGMGQAIDHSGVDNESSDQLHHQDGGFNVGRGANSGSNTNVGPHQSSFVAMDAFLPGSANQSTAHLSPHGMHGNIYPCQYGHNQSHQQSHHRSHHIQTRGGLSGGGGPGRGHSHHGSSFPSSSGSNAPMSGAPHLTPQGTVLMIYGLNVDRINCDRLFNLFCLYGNVVRVKFLRSKEGCAMVQMGDGIAVDRSLNSVNKITLFGNELQVSYSKQAFLHDVLNPFTLPDGTPSFKDFMGNKNNRFRNPEVAIKNRILPPSRVLHFFNAPFGISDDELIVLFKQTAGYEPVSLKIFTPKVDNAKSFSGLVTFRDPAEATEALVLCNHLSLPKAGAPHPYILRLCFSPPTTFAN